MNGGEKRVNLARDAAIAILKIKAWQGKKKWPGRERGGGRQQSGSTLGFRRHPSFPATLPAVFPTRHPTPEEQLSSAESREPNLAKA